jgi:predicted AAA+ superfamily ATPase
VDILKRKIEKELIEWKNKTDTRMPLILNGARQVGKTYILQEFGLKYFKNTVYINLETNLSVASYFDDNIDPERIIQFLESYANERIIPGETLILFDEIQVAERVLTSLKYFCEQAPEYHIAAAGSLLGVAINRESYSYPVGKVDTLTLYPMDFEEFLWACDEEMLVRTIRKHYITMEPMAEVLHKKAVDYYRLYLIIGGMPAVINEYIRTKSLVTVPDIQNKIMNDYIADMAKYATSADSVKIRACYHSIPAQLGKDNRKFQYSIVRKGGSSTLFGEAIDWLTFAGVVQKCRNITQGYDPISVYTNLANFKLYMGDVGLLTMKTGISQHTILSGESNLFMGALTENYVAQALSAKRYDLYYWTMVP